MVATVFEHFSVQLYVLGVVLGALTVPLVLRSRKGSQAKTAWILVLLGWPWFGVLFYAVFGRNRLQRKVARLRQATVSALGGVDQRVQAVARGSSESASRLAKDLVLEATAISGLPLYLGNEFTLYPEGDAGFRRVGEVIDAARHHVHVLTYIFKADETGHMALDRLVAAAKRGVQVRLVYDALGSYETRSRFFTPLVEAGGHVTAFLPIRLFDQWTRWNLRNHRKITVVDGHTAFIGGRNVGNEYARDPMWRDLHLELRGPAVCGLQRVFLEDWNFATDELLDDDAYFEQATPAGSVPVQVLASGPDDTSGSLEGIFFSAIAGARDRVDLVTPYFVPTEPVVAAVRSALLKGRRVRLLFGRKVDHRITRWAGEWMMEPLLADGLEIWQHPGMVHAKVLVVDDQWATVGSTNFDARSFRLNFEANVAFAQASAARRVREYVDREISVARRLGPEDFRYGLPRRFAREAAGLFAPIL